MEKCRITELDRIGPFPNDENKRTVLSLSTPTVHTVEIKSKGKQFVCDNHCLRFKVCAICAHTVAVAHEVGKLEELVACLPSAPWSNGTSTDPWRSRKER